MKYDDDSPLPIEGAFYASASYEQHTFNYFREEEELDLQKLLNPVNDEVENLVLSDNNKVAIKHDPEFATNKDPNSPTNKICTSLLSRDRLAFILQYSIAYVDEESGLQKHIMRYPQVVCNKSN